MFALFIGPVDISSTTVIKSIFSLVGLIDLQGSSTEQLVVNVVRLPRVFVAIIGGSALGISGAMIQNVFRNPMADPGIIGISSGASLGAVTSIRFGLAAITPIFLPLFAFIGAALCVTFVQSISRIGGRYSTSAMLLAGIATSSLISAIVSIIVLFTRDFGAQREMIFWMAGGLEASNWQDVILSGIPFTACLFVAVFFSRDMNLLTTTEDEAKSLGVRVGLVRNTLIATTALATGSVVAVSGTIGFIGLIAPHCIRLIVGADNRIVIPLSALLGAIVLISADIVARTVVSPAELPVGIICALFGVPFFMYLLIRYKQNVTQL